MATSLTCFAPPGFFAIAEHPALANPEEKTQDEVRPLPSPSPIASPDVGLFWLELFRLAGEVVKNLMVLHHDIAHASFVEFESCFQNPSAYSLSVVVITMHVPTFRVIRYVIRNKLFLQ